MSNTDQNLSAIFVQLILAIIMLAVAFEVTIADLKLLPRQWKKILLGYSMQVIFLPALIVLMLLGINPQINMIIAFLLLAACPGGNLSQFFVVRSGGNVALSMGLTFLSTLLSPITVPAVFYFATHVNSEWIEVYKTLNLEWGNIFKTLIQSLFIPLVLGMWIANRPGKGWMTLRKRIQQSVPFLLVTILSGAVWSFRTSIPMLSLGMILMVVMVSLSSLASSYFLSRLVKQDYTTSVTYAWEVSIQNSGLGMVLGIVYFSHVPEVSLVCALWGIWQMGMGYIITSIIKKRIPQSEVICQATNVG